MVPPMQYAIKHYHRITIISPYTVFVIMVSVTSILEFVTFLADLVGVSQVSRKNKQSYKVAKWRIVYSIILLCCQIGYLPFFAATYEFEGSFADEIVEIYLIFVNPFTLYFAIICSLICRKTLMEFLNRILKANEDLKKLQGCSTKVPIKLGIILTICFFWYFISGLSEWLDWWNIPILVISLYTLILFLQIGTYAIVIRSMLRSLGQEVRKCLEGDAKKDMKMFTKRLGGNLQFALDTYDKKNVCIFTFYDT